MIAALYANTNLDAKEADRPKIIEEVDRAYDGMIAAVYGVIAVEEQAVDQELAENPFFTKMNVPGRELYEYELKNPPLAEHGSIVPQPVTDQ